MESFGSLLLFGPAVSADEVARTENDEHDAGADESAKPSAFGAGRRTHQRKEDEERRARMRAAVRKRAATADDVADEADLCFIHEELECSLRSSARVFLDEMPISRTLGELERRIPR
jgi:hypothetical protein